jgi:cyclic pyranopterin phosphate synthase
MKRKLTHVDRRGAARMVDVGGKRITERAASARAVIILPRACWRALAAGGDTRKGNVLQLARCAGIMAAKRTSEIIPLCHQLLLDAVDVDFHLGAQDLEVTAQVRCRARTGVEMEALVAVSAAALTVYDMLKALSHDIVIARIELERKTGGSSGPIRRRVAR